MTLELMTIIGPRLDRDQLPPKMANYCPSNFQIFATKQVPVNSPNVRPTANKSEVLLDDPLFKREVQYDDPVPDFSDLFQVLPPSNRSSRVKRECRRADMSIDVDNCEWADSKVSRIKFGFLTLRTYYFAINTLIAPDKMYRRLSSSTN